MTKNISFILGFMVFFYSCKSSTSSRDIPSWLISLDGYRNSGLVATGCAYMHVKGLDAQKKLAMQRAIEELSMQKSTTINSISTKKEKRNNGSLSSSSYKNQSTYTTNTNVSFEIKETYFNEKNQQYCVLIKG